MNLTPGPQDFAPVDDVAQLVRAKDGRTVTVCIPARNEEATIGAIVDEVRATLMGGPGERLVDELIVVDDRSVDQTGTIARRSGATVIPISVRDLSSEGGGGKGNALWAGVRGAKGDLMVFCDADLLSFSHRYVTRLVAPLLTDPDVMIVKAFYDRPADAAGEGGGRTTELLARPLLTLLFPALGVLRQPLSGEFAARRQALCEVPFVEGYGVEVGLLVDLLRRYGPSAIGQVDLGIKKHRHRTLAELAVQATEIAAVLLQRAGAWTPGAEGIVAAYGGVERTAVPYAERPPLAGEASPTD